jgi:Tfp pilus assembly protein PilX
MSLIMLVVLSMIAVSATYSTTASLRIVGNMQSSEEALIAAQQAINDELSSLSNFTAAASKTVRVDIDRDGTADYTVQLDAPVCDATADLVGSYSATISYPPQNTYWKIRTVVTDIRNTGSRTTVYEGVKILLLPYMGC